MTPIGGITPVLQRISDIGHIAVTLMLPVPLMTERLVVLLGVSGSSLTIRSPGGCG